MFSLDVVLRHARKTKTTRKKAQAENEVFLLIVLGTSFTLPLDP